MSITSEYRHPIQTKGKFQIVALTRESEFDQQDVYAYAVMVRAVPTGVPPRTLPLSASRAPVSIR